MTTWLIPAAFPPAGISTTNACCRWPGPVVPAVVARSFDTPYPSIAEKCLHIVTDDAQPLTPRVVLSKSEMAYDEALAERVRKAIRDQPNVTERKMFGGLAFMVGGHMCCGIVGDDLMVRVGHDAYEEALSKPHARPMDFTGRPLKGMVYVARSGLRTEKALRGWVDRGVSFTTTLPAKGPASRKVKTLRR